MKPHDLSDCFDHILDAASRIEDIALKTPVFTSTTLDQMSGAKVFLKCENMQRVGAFKFRGAYNTISRLTEEEKSKGVVAVSSGNHGQAVALVCRMLEISATIIMPDDAPRIKLDAVKGYGAEVVLFDRQGDKRDDALSEFLSKNDATFVPPYDHPHIIAGQGTSALELVNEIESLNTLLVPVGGGGLLAGSSIAVKSVNPNCRVIGVEPEQANDAYQSFKSGEIHHIDHPDTIADGTRTESLGNLNFEIIKRYVDDIVTVSEQAIIDAVKFLLFRAKLVVEPSGALGVAALLSQSVSTAGNTGVIISGGNIDPETVNSILK